MTVRLRASVIPGLALSALALAGCASQGTIGTSAAGAAGGSLPGAASSTPAGGTSATGTSAPSSASTDSSAPSAPASSSQAAPSSQDPSALASSLKTLNSLWTDPGCKTALAGFSTFLYAQEQGQAQGIAAIPGALPKIRAGAQQTKKPGASQPINKLAADLQTMYSQAQQGKTPDKGPVKQDFQIMGNICSQP
ncbi:hypothetical protein ABH935_004399 [Catenulispora sp. GAS73]|uniref:hypothetical protein n=1 Tax=Catenulispora sp. GAS73 TaxID=3156269 RepID=UPI003510E7A9